MKCMNLTEEQKALLKKYNIDIPDNPKDINILLLDLDDKITSIGFNSDDSLNENGLKLQKLYDEIYQQN